MVAGSLGLGEQLSPLPPLPDCHILICKPPFPISTPVLFRRSDASEITDHPDTAGMLDAIEAGDAPGVAARVFNVFEAVLGQTEQEAVFSIRETLLALGASAAAMTGSGPTVFGLFTGLHQAQLAYHHLKRSYQQTFLSEFV